MGGIGGARAKRARLEAERLASADDVATPAFLAQLRDRTTLALNWGSGLAIVVILVLMIWKPGA
jgi:type II secretory pathway component PulM